MLKKLTIDKLAAMTAREFYDSRNYLDKRLHEVEERILHAIEGLEFKTGLLRLELATRF